MALENAKPRTAPEGDVADAKSVALASRRFGVALYEALGEHPSNLIYSPLSVFTLLALVQQGARSFTEEELKRALHWPGETQALALAVRAFAAALRAGSGAETFTLTSANGLWLQQGLALRPEFEETLRTSFGATYTPVDFARSQEVSLLINDWAREQTRGLIDSIVQPEMLLPTTRFCLANAVYFQAHWREPFPRALTQPGPFRLLDGSTVEVPMMHQPEGCFGYASGRWCEVLELPYQGEHVSLWLLIPSSADDFSHCEHLLGDERRLEALFAGTRRTTLDVAMPRLSLHQHISLGAVAERLGFGSLLGYSDLTGMTPEGECLTGDLVHEATFSADEEKTVAAAVTMLVDSMGGGPMSVVVNRPFLFFLRHASTGTVLFMGRVMDPRG